LRSGKRPWPERPLLAIVEDLEEIAAGLVAERSESEIVDDDEVGTSELSVERRALLHRGVTGELFDEAR
jgi:hypothetical protein